MQFILNYSNSDFSVVNKANKPVGKRETCNLSENFPRQGGTVCRASFCTRAAGHTGTPGPGPSGWPHYCHANTICDNKDGLHT